MNKKKVYSIELKMKAIHLREEGWTYKAIAKELNIKMFHNPNNGGIGTGMEKLIDYLNLSENNTVLLMVQKEGHL